MPTRKRRLSQPAAAPKTRVVLTGKEKLKVGRECLGIVGPSERSERVKIFQQKLDGWARELANASAVALRSDLLSRVKPITTRIQTLQTLIRRERELLMLAAYKGFIAPEVLAEQLDGFDKLAAWMEEEKPKRGGERRSFRKQVNDCWKAQLGEWFDENAVAASKKERARRRSSFLRLAQIAVNRALKSP